MEKIELTHKGYEWNKLISKIRTKKQWNIGEKIHSENDFQLSTEDKNRIKIFSCMKKFKT
jgi:hypothetical protein